MKPGFLFIIGVVMVVGAFFSEGNGLIFARLGQYAIIASVILWIVKSLRPQQPPRDDE